MSSLLVWLHRLTIGVLLTLVAVPFAQVIVRNLSSLSFVGSEELSRILLIFLVFLGYPLVVASNGNIAMNELHAFLPERARRWLVRFIALCSLAVAALFAWAAFTTAMRNLGNATPTLKLPFWLFLSAAGTAFTLAFLIHLVQLVTGRDRLASPAE